MNLPRRTFLLQAGTAVAGLSALGCNDSEAIPLLLQAGTPPKKPQVLVDALERMKAENKAGVAVRIPENGKMRHYAGHDVAYALNMDQVEVRDAFTEVVVVCLESSVIETFISSSYSNHELVLFNEESRAEAGRPFNFQENWADLPKAIADLAHGPDGSRLKRRAEAIRQKAEPGIQAAVDRVGTNPDTLEVDKAALLKEASRIMALLIHSLREAKAAPRQQALRAVIDASYAASKPGDTGPKLPFGMELGPAQGGCGGDSCQEQAPEEKMSRVLVACGMARVKPNDRSFLRYLTK